MASAEARINGDHLQQAVMNLLLNAIDAAGPGGAVSLSVEPKNGHVEVCVADSGPGLSEEERLHLFEAFYTTKVSGTGLGLAVSRTLLERMDASIEYVAQEGGGARFRILLPAAEAGV
jgi:signal transduction histidine kinase